MVKPAAVAKKNSTTKVAEKKKVQTSNKYEALRELNDGAEPDASGWSEQRKVRFDLRKELLPVQPRVHCQIYQLCVRRWNTS